jgi:hypothetical protein
VKATAKSLVLSIMFLFCDFSDEDLQDMVDNHLGDLDVSIDYEGNSEEEPVCEGELNPDKNQRRSPRIHESSRKATGQKDSNAKGRERKSANEHVNKRSRLVVREHMALGDDPVEDQRLRDLANFEQWEFLRRGKLCVTALKNLEHALQLQVTTAFPTNDQLKTSFHDDSLSNATQLSLVDTD